MFIALVGRCYVLAPEEHNVPSHKPNISLSGAIRSPGKLTFYKYFVPPGLKTLDGPSVLERVLERDGACRPAIYSPRFLSP